VGLDRIIPGWSLILSLKPNVIISLWEFGMGLNLIQKKVLKKELVDCLSGDQEILRIVVFGSFVTSETPADMDVAVFQSSDEDYIPLAMKYRRQTRRVSRRIPLDIIPLRAGITDSPFLREIESGETIYER
jgi:predicted nucleotidyltransferase